MSTQGTSTKRDAAFSSSVAAPAGAAGHTAGDTENERGPRSSPWQGLVAAIRYILPVRSLGSTLPAHLYAGAPRWIVPIGLVIGLAWAGLFRMTWRVYGETGGLRLIPSLAIVLLESLFTGVLLILGLVRTIHVLGGNRPVTERLDPAAPLSPSATLALVLVVLGQWILIASIPVVNPWWPTMGWRRHFNFLYPAPVYRPLLLAPIWGRWGLLAAACIGRTSRNADAETVALCANVRPSLLLYSAILPLALSAVYFARDGNLLLGVIAGLIVFGITYLAAVVMARRGGGQTRQSLYAAAQVAQLVFLAVYRALWPLIHG